jgi:predicted RNase H-like HicB family nuclease
MKIEYATQIIWSPEDGAYLAIPNELPGCVADGQTPEEALANLKVVIDEWIETAKEQGRPAPKPMTLADLGKLQQKAQADLQRHIQDQVQIAISQVLEQLLQKQHAAAGWNLRGGLAFDPAEHLELAGGSRRR